MDNNIKASQTRAVQYWFADGLTELSGGILCLLLAIYFSLQQFLPATQGSFALVFLMLFVASFGVRKLMLWFRERSTYGRTGFIQPKKSWEDRRLLGIAIGFTVMLLSFMLFTILRGVNTMVWMPAIGGIIFTFMFALVGFEAKLVRFVYLAIFSLILGVSLAVSGLGDFWGAALLSLVVGLVLFAYGIITRLSYLRQSPIYTEQTDEG